MNKKLSFDEFKLFYESTEKVTDRRLETNRWNYSICVAILTAVAAIAVWSLKDANAFFVGATAIALLCLVATFFCALWIGQIRDFKKLNNAKFAVLNDMAPKIEFDLEHPGLVESYCPFEKEWKKLQELDALEEVGKSHIIVLKSSNIEYFIPKAFQVLFCAVLALVVISAIRGPSGIVSAPAAASATPAPAKNTNP
jgi:hypothetical protein